jgi:hypothetical protein
VISGKTHPANVRRGAMNRTTIFKTLPRMFRVGLAALLVGLVGQAHAIVTGWMGDAVGTERTFTLTAKHDFISTSDGNSHYTWGYAHDELPMQYPGPTLIVNQGDTVKIVLNNSLPVPVSIIFPGQQGVSAAGGIPGLLTQEARAVSAAELAQNTVVAGPTYSFVASQPGTYLYHSGTNTDLQVEMGLVGALIVRPTGYDQGTGIAHPNRKAYEQAGTSYDRENLFLLTEIDPDIHWTVYAQVFSGLTVAVDTTVTHPSIWFINGRNAPDTLLDDHVYWLPTQPYNALPLMHPGERMLMRMVNAGRDLHPFHHHGNHATPIARDGRVLSSVPADLTKAPDLTSPDFTVRSVPGQTVDLIYEWTGKGIGWDIYGTTAINPHACTPDVNGYHSVASDKNYREWCADHNKALPVLVAGQLDLSFGENYGGTPFLGMLGSLPQGHPGLNVSGGYFHMWHSHNEKEVTTDDIFPGGMMTMLIIEPWTVDLDAGTGPVQTGGSGGGTGANPTVAFTAELGPGAFNPGMTALNFGDVGTVTNTVTLTVGGTAPATFGTATVDNVAPNVSTRFGKSTDTCSGTTKQVGGTCQITITFNGSANGATVRNGIVTVPYSGSGSPALLNLTGN